MSQDYYKEPKSKGHRVELTPPVYTKIMLVKYSRFENPTIPDLCLELIEEALKLPKYRKAIDTQLGNNTQ